MQRNFTKRKVKLDTNTPASLSSSPCGPEKIMSTYGEAFDLSGFDRLRPAPQGCRASERSVGSVLVVVPLVLTQRLPQMDLIPEQRAAQQVAAKVLAPVDTTQRRKID
ncbi:hypothetical protein [Lentzea kentuckyensis]|uniref:hypothetical protein n=1 Tax=Lentzea kentuckyensis TaxID=360086 RepID=UPI001302DBC8|nr:hypothetical protein [Lentzea kentuckyensis]